MAGPGGVHCLMLLAVAVLGPGSQVEAFLNCQSPGSIQAAYKSCLHRNNVSLAILDHHVASVEDAIVSEHADVICSYPTKAYQDAVECISDISHQCLPQEVSNLTPKPAQWVRMITTICVNRQDIELQCVTRQIHAATQCGQRKVHEYLAVEGNPPSESERLCWAYEIMFECFVEVYTHCNCKTAELYSDLVLDILMPNSCVQRPDLESNRVVCMAVSEHHEPTTPTTPLAPLPDHVTPDCQSVSDVKRGIVQCFTNEEIHDPQLFNDFQNSAAPPNTILETLFIHYGDSACSSHKLRYQEALKCTFQLARDCVPATYRQLLPSPDIAAAHVDYLCDHRKDADLLCVSKKTAALLSCAHRRGLQYASNGGSMDDILCFAYKAEFECNQEVYKDCGCETAKIYSDMSLDLRYPKSCPRQELEKDRLTCQDDTRSDTRTEAVIRPSDVEKTNAGSPGRGIYQVVSGRCLDTKKTEVQSCYTDRGFKYYDDGRDGSVHFFFGSILDSVMRENNDMCSRRMIGAARAAVLCESKIIQYCLSVDQKEAFSDLSKLLRVFNGLCDQWDEIDGTCAYRQFRKFGSCQEHSQSASFSDVDWSERENCRNVRRLGDCAKDILLTCGCSTARAYSDQIFSYMLLDVCRQSDDAPRFMKCHASNPYVYEHQPEEEENDDDGSGAGKLLSSLWALVVASCLARLFLHYP